MTDLPTPIKITELANLQTTTMENAIVPISQLGITGTTRIRTNPMNQVNVLDEQSLFDHFPDGSGGILIPDSSAWTIDVDDNFTLSKAIKIGENATLVLRGATSNVTITYTGDGGEGAMIQNENILNLITDFNIKSLNLTSATAQPLFNLAGSFFRMIETNIRVFASLGTLDFPIPVIEFSAGFDIGDGIVLKNIQSLEFDNFSYAPSASLPSITFITLLGSSNPTITIRNSFMFNPNAQFIYITPEFGTSTEILLQTIKGVFLNLFVAGLASTDVTSVSDFGGNARFSASGNDLVANVGYVFHSGFDVVPVYNGTFKMGSKPTGAQYMLVGSSFAGNDDGFVTKKSLDQTDVRVTGLNNSGTPDSQTQAETNVNGTINMVPTTIYQPLQDDTPTPGDFIVDSATEGLSVDTSTGIIINISLKPINVTISFESTITKTSGGGTSSADIALHIDGVIQPKTERPVVDYSVSAMISVTYPRGIFTLQPAEEAQLFINTDSVDPIAITNTSVVVTT